MDHQKHDTHATPSQPGDLATGLREPAHVFPEEIAWRTPGDGWVFVVRTRPAGSREARRRAGDRRTRAASMAVSLARAGRYGTSDMSARIPVLAPFRDRMVSVFGLGGLGAPSALEFARAGVGCNSLARASAASASSTATSPRPGMASGGQWA